MPDYNVMVQNVEENDEAYSVTGTVNGIQEAAVIRKQRLPKGLKGGKLEKAFADALVDEFRARPKETPKADAIKVSRND